ncbi:MAG TPA: hypothetical protein PL029_07905 [Bacteroidia bacterium]|nr:hypothetical protein [Bacteroidia bacterium]
MKTSIKTIKQQLFSDSSGRMVKLALLSGIIFSALVSVSSTLPHTTPGNNETEKAIKNYFRFPQVLLPHAEPKSYTSKKVEVLFTTDAQGRVNFVLAKTDDHLLKREVEKQFYKLRLPKITTEVVHSVVLNFKTL